MSHFVSVLCINLWLVVNFSQITVAQNILSCISTENVEHVTVDKTICQMKKTFFSFLKTDDIDECSTYIMKLEAELSCCYFDSVRVEIDVVEHAKSELECVSNKSKPHSNDNLIADINSTCSKLEITYPVAGIFNGCYLITLTPSCTDGSFKHSKIPILYTKWIQNNYTADSFELEPTFTASNFPDHVFLKWNFGKKMCGITEYDIVLFNSSTEMSVTENCTLTDVEIHCNLFDLPYTKYLVNLDLSQNPRCIDLDGVLSNCSFADDFERNPYSEANVSVRKFPSMLIIIILIVVVIVTSTMFVIYISLRIAKGKLKHNLTYNGSANEQGLNSDMTLTDDLNKKIENDNDIESIFLIYARDCDIFMDLMKEFRNILSKVTGYKVYDLFDDTQFKLIGPSPNDWISNMFDDKSVKVVLVATDLGNILYNTTTDYYSMKKNGKSYEPAYLRYKEVDSMDQYVLSAMKRVSENVNTPTMEAPYRKHIVCRIPSIMKSQNSFKDIIPFTRFDLPSQMDNLIVKLMSLSSDLPVSNGTLNGNLKLKFVNRLNDLKTYIEANPDYLSQILYDTE